jgi:hypothetical protein
MPTTTLTPSPKQQYFDANGNPLAGGKLYTYAGGTSTPLATYTNATDSTFNPNPIILDSRGEANVWLVPGTLYKFKLTDASDVQIWVVDQISTPVASSGSVTSVALAAPALFTVTGSPITSSGTLTLAYSGTALPAANGGTGLTAPGTSGNVLTSNGTAWVSSTPSSGGSVTSVAMSVPSVFSVAGSPITTSGTLAVTYSGTALPAANGGTGVTAPGTSGNVLTSNGSAWVSSAPTGGTTTLGAVGAYGFFQAGTLGSYVGLNPGDTTAGSNLTYCNAGNAPAGGSPSGTWRCMGYTVGGTTDGPGNTTLFVRTI